jgi:hypothetical protein
MAKAGPNRGATSFRRWTTLYQKNPKDTILFKFARLPDRLPFVMKDVRANLDWAAGWQLIMFLIDKDSARSRHPKPNSISDDHDL